MIQLVYQVKGVFFFMEYKYKYAPSIVLNKYKRHEDGRTLPIEIFGSNSKQGTSIYLTPINTLFDIGVNFQKIEHLQDITDFIMISHEHSDHLNWHTLNTILLGHPTLQVLLPYFITVPTKYNHLMKHIIQVFDESSIALTMRDGQHINVDAFEMPHGNETSFSYEVTFQNAHLLFSTDLSNTSHLPQFIKFDIIMIETNYDQDEFISKNGAGGAIAHLSVQDAIAYATSHLDEFGKIIPLHFGPTMINYNQLH